MSTSEKILYALFFILVGIVIYSNRKLLFGGKQAPTEGTPCSTTGGAVNDGTIVNGVCTITPPKDGTPCKTKEDKDGTIVGGKCIENGNQMSNPQQSSNQIRITNPAGARVLMFDGTKFSSPVNGVIIPVNTILTVTQYIPSPKVYYNTAQGWIDGNDAVVYIP